MLLLLLQGPVGITVVSRSTSPPARCAELSYRLFLSCFQLGLTCTASRTDTPSHSIMILAHARESYSSAFGKRTLDVGCKRPMSRSIFSKRSYVPKLSERRKEMSLSGGFSIFGCGNSGSPKMTVCGYGDEKGQNTSSVFRTGDPQRVIRPALPLYWVGCAAAKPTGAKFRLYITDRLVILSHMTRLAEY